MTMNNVIHKTFKSGNDASEFEQQVHKMLLARFGCIWQDGQQFYEQSLAKAELGHMMRLPSSYSSLTISGSVYPKWRICYYNYDLTKGGSNRFEKDVYSVAIELEDEITAVEIALTI